MACADRFIGRLSFVLASVIPVALAAQGAPAASSGESRPRADTLPSLYTLLSLSCPDSGTVLEPIGSPSILLTPDGRMVRSLDRPVNEGDTLHVDVWGDNRLLPLLLVTRKSDVRVLGNVNVVGAGEQALRQAIRAPKCDHRSFTLSDLAPGKGELEITARWPTRSTDGDNVGYTAESLATVQFPVNQLYAGAIFFGPVVTGLRNPDFGIRVAGADTTIAYATRPGARIEYAVFYTPFWFHTRDIAANQCRWWLWCHVVPTIGLVLNDVPNNLLVGLTAQVGYTAYFVAGAQVGVVRQLDQSSNLGVGSKISGGAAAIPVNSRVDVSWYGGIGLDLRAVGKLLKPAVQVVEGSGRNRPYV